MQYNEAHEERHNLLNSSCLYSLDRKTYNCVIDHPDFKYFAELLNYIKSDGEIVKGTLDGMKRVLKRMFGVNFEITIIDNCGQPDFFGCNIFPTEDVLKDVSRRLISNDDTKLDTLRHIWNHNETWQMDLDSRMFYDTNIKLNPAEIAAIIFFNIENVVFNLRPLERTVVIIKQLINQNGLLVNNLARTSIGSHTFMLPLIQACLFKSYPLEEETQIVDGSCFHMCHELDSYLRNAVRKVLVSVSNDNIDVPLDRIDSDIVNVAQWVFAAISDMRYSTRLIQQTIKKLILTVRSPYLQTIYSGILMEIGDYSRKQVATMESVNPEEQRRFLLNPKAVEFRMESYRRQAQKKISAECERVIKEGFLDLLDNLGNMPKVNQKEIDMIRVQVQKIETVDDKMYILDELHAKMDIVEASLTLLESPDEKQRKKVKLSKSALMDQKKQLDETRDAIIRREIKEPEYTLHVGYPKGYDG